ncbi:MAG: transposase [Lachnospiraceae bacterium]|nr:transposase [Lachnospiraceae bacterium]
MTRSFGWLKKTPQISTDIKIAAIDDFALKKRHNYGTVLIDANDHRIVDMIESRDKEDVTEWLCSFRNIEIFTRDGSSSYAVSISDSHPDALQVMDRFHILFHLTDYGKDYINRTVKAAEPIEGEEITQEDIPHFETTYDKIMAAKALKKQGKTYVEISNELFVSEMTARKYVNISEEEAEKYKRKTDLHTIPLSAY